MRRRRIVTVNDRTAPAPGQPDLFTATPAEDQSIEARFERFHAEHPDVYRLLCHLARSHRTRAGYVPGMKALFEVARYQLATEGERFTLNNNFTALYSRLIMATEPDLADAFTIRERVAS